MTRISQSSYVWSAHEISVCRKSSTRLWTGMMMETSGIGRHCSKSFHGEIVKFGIVPAAAEPGPACTVGTVRNLADGGIIHVGRYGCSLKGEREPMPHRRIKRLQRPGREGLQVILFGI